MSGGDEERVLIFLTVCALALMAGVTALYLLFQSDRRRREQLARAAEQLEGRLVKRWWRALPAIQGSSHGLPLQIEVVQSSTEAYQVRIRFLLARPAPPKAAIERRIEEQVKWHPWAFRVRVRGQEVTLIFEDLLPLSGLPKIPSDLVPMVQNAARALA